MFGRTPYEAWIRYADPLQDALQCIAPGRFVLRGSQAGLRNASDYAVTLNDMDSVPLKGPSPLHLVAGQIIRIHEATPERRSERFRVLISAYTYGIVLRDDRGEHELLMFHWNRERNRVERLINRLKQHRAIATRYVKLQETYHPLLTLACILLWL